MSAIGVVLLAEVPVCTAAILGAMAEVYRRGRARDDARDSALAVQTAGLAVLVARVDPLAHDTRDNGRAIGSLRETTAALAATIEAHLIAGHPAISASVRPSPRPW